MRFPFVWFYKEVPELERIRNQAVKMIAWAKNKRFKFGRNSHFQNPWKNKNLGQNYQKKMKSVIYPQTVVHFFSITTIDPISLQIPMHEFVIRTNSIPGNNFLLLSTVCILRVNFEQKNAIFFFVPCLLAIKRENLLAFHFEV